MHVTSVVSDFLQSYGRLGSSVHEMPQVRNTGVNSSFIQNCLNLNSQVTLQQVNR